MYIIGMILLSFFALVGIAFFIDAVSSALHRVKGDMILLLPSLSADDAEARTRQAARLCEREDGTAVICLCEQGSEAEVICERLKYEYPCITVTDAAHFTGAQE